MEDPGGIKSAALPAPEAQVGGVPEGRRKHVMLGLKLLAGLLIIAAPVYLADHFIPGFFGVAFFGVLAATFGWMSGGPKVGAGVVVSLSILGLASILLREHTVLLALILLGLGALYGYAASRGVGKAVLQLPILTPYFMMAPPALFNYPPTIDVQYAVGIVVIVNLAGGWALLVLHLALGTRHLKPMVVPDRRVPLLYGTLMGVISAVVMTLGTSTELKSHWVWVTLTLYVLADPVQLLTWKRMWGASDGHLCGLWRGVSSRDRRGTRRGLAADGARCALVVPLLPGTQTALLAVCALPHCRGGADELEGDQHAVAQRRAVWLHYHRRSLFGSCCVSGEICDETLGERPGQQRELGPCGNP